MTLEIDPVIFRPEAVSDETRAHNEWVLDLMRSAPDMWSMEPQFVRDARVDGRGPFPVEPEEPTATTITITVDNRHIDLRVFEPKSKKTLGTYLHIHGGGWMVGTALAHDVRLQEIADNCQLSCVSVEYRLAPEHPYPAGPDDCEAAALWLLSDDHGFNKEYLAIGGESAGAHLSALTLIRLRDKASTCPFHAAILTAGVYDLGQSPSARNWGEERLILNTRDMQMFATAYLHGGEDKRDPAISPLFARLNGLPPTLFSVGTKDLLLDDTLQMATLWHAANGNAELDVAPGGCHVFQSFRHLKIARASNAYIDAFLNRTRENLD